MKGYLAFFSSVVVFSLASPIVFAFQRIRYLVRRKDFGKYLWAIAIGIDQLGGSVLYGKMNWTVSGYTHYLATRGNVWAERFERFIDAIFGQGHCEEAYVWDLNYDAGREL